MFFDFYKTSKNDIWHGKSRFLHGFLGNTGGVLDSGQKSQELSFALFKTRFGLKLTDLQTFENITILTFFVFFFHVIFAPKIDTIFTFCANLTGSFRHILNKQNTIIRHFPPYMRPHCVLSILPLEYQV